MELKKAIIVKLFPVETGVNKKGEPWRNRKIKVKDSMPVPYPDEFLITFTREKADMFNDMREGDMIDIGWSAKVREFTYEDRVTHEQRTKYEQENLGFSIGHV